MKSTARKVTTSHIACLALAILTSCFETEDVATSQQAIGEFCPANPPHVCQPNNLQANWTCTLLCQDEAGYGASAYCPEITDFELTNCGISCSWIEPPNWLPHSPEYSLCYNNCVKSIQHKCVSGELP